MSRKTLATLPLVLLTLGASALAQDPREAFETQPETGTPPAWTLGSGRTLRLFPASDVHSVYIADPHRPVNGAEALVYTRTGIFDSTTERFGLAAGGRFGIVRLDPSCPGGRSWQLSIDAGLKAQFDSNHKNDNVGWDGNYGLSLTTASGPLSFRLAIFHNSAHIGDEYARRTGRTRLDYTREELAFGVARRLRGGWRVYSEAAYGYFRLTEEQRPWRAQGGLEYTTRPTLLGGRFSWYSAVDVSATEERDWRPDTAVQTGLTATSNGRRWRVGVQYIDGRPPLGEFFQDTEAWFALGVWMDL